MARTLVLVGCGAAKNPGKLPAREKYSSNYSHLKNEYAEVVGDDWFIVSAKYGVVHPDERIDDYDVTVRDMNAEERENWGNRTGNEIVEEVDRIIDDRDEVIDEIHLLLGSAYQEPLMEDLLWLEARGVELVKPFEDTSGIGEQMAKLKELTEEARDE